MLLRILPFVVNNENYMSYLVRLKKQGSVGFHQIYHKYMYKTRKNDYNYDPMNYIIDMDIHKEDFESELDQLKPMEEIPIENINLTFLE